MVMMSMGIASVDYILQFLMWLLS